MSFNNRIWEGVYKTYQEALDNSMGLGFSSDVRLTAACDKIIEHRKRRLLENNPFPIGNRFSSLPPIVSTEIKNDETISILDFGGGPGTQYELLKDSISNDALINYHIVETKETVVAGRELFDDDKSIKFHTEFPDHKVNTTIAYSNSALQYIDDWFHVIRKMTEENPVYLILDDLPAGKFDEFVSIQNYYDSRIPHRFFNITNVVNSISELGYTLLCKSTYFGEILGKLSSWPMDNFDKNYQLDHSCNLLFKK
jgi:putative methyltransferase (TIGR04325 family)